MIAKFFTVADPEIGLGHLFRCDALAYALLLNGYDVELLIECSSGREWLEEKPLYSSWRNIKWTDSRQAVHMILNSCDVPVFDAYQVDDSVWDEVRNSDKQCVVFDDYGEKPELAGILINGSPGATSLSYSNFPGRILLLGPSYQVLRPPFWQKKERTIQHTIKRVGIILGGTASINLLRSVIDEVIKIMGEDVKITAIGKNIDTALYSNVDSTGFLPAKKIKDIFYSLDLLISAAGQSLAEAVACELPFIMIKTASNQETNIRGWTDLYSVPSIKSICKKDVQRNIYQLKDYNERKKMVKIFKNINIISATLNLATLIDKRYDDRNCYRG